MRVVAVVPAYNEAAVVADVVRGLRPHVGEVVVVDDGSSDRTAVLARDAGATVLRHLVNRGQGAALETGTQLALQRGADVVVHFDADGQHDPADLPRLTRPVVQGQADVAFGSRFLGRAPNLPLVRRVTLKLGLLFTGVFSGLWLTDTNNGLRVFSRTAAAALRITHDRMAHASEIIDLVAGHGLRYVEVPVTVRYTSYSLSRGQGSGNAFGIVGRLIVGKFF